MKEFLSKTDALAIARIHGASWVAFNDNRKIYVFRDKPEIKSANGSHYWKDFGLTNFMIGLAGTGWPEWENSLMEVNPVNAPAEDNDLIITLQTKRGFTISEEMQTFMGRTGINNAKKVLMKSMEMLSTCVTRIDYIINRDNSQEELVYTTRWGTHSIISTEGCLLDMVTNTSY